MLLSHHKLSRALTIPGASGGNIWHRQGRKYHKECHRAKEENSLIIRNFYIITFSPLSFTRVLKQSTNRNYKNKVHTLVYRIQLHVTDMQIILFYLFLIIKS